jgi:hypothetical protein
MADIILSMPAVYLYLLTVVALLITGLRTREAGPPVGDAAVAARCHLGRAPLRNAALPPRRDRRPFLKLQATLSARYAARLEQAIRTIRARPPAGARPTDPAAGRRHAGAVPQARKNRLMDRNSPQETAVRPPYHSGRAGWGGDCSGDPGPV